MSALGIAEIVEISEVIDSEEQFVSRITERWWRIYRDVVAIGKDLYAAQQTLPYGQFDRMLRTKLPFIRRSTAYNYIDHYLIAISTDENVQSIGQLGVGYSITNILAKTEETHPGSYGRGIKEGKIFPGMSQRKALEWKSEVASTYQHAPIAARTITSPSRPEGSAATKGPELVHLLTEWRKALGVSQADLDGRIGWADGFTSKTEIPHSNDGKRFTLWPTQDSPDGTLWDYLKGLGLGLAVVKLEPN